jgi:hypothetical protein
MNKIAIVTSLCGDKEVLHNPTIVHPNADYYAFVSKQHPSATVWKQLSAYSFSNDPKYALRRNAKIYKILTNFFLPNYEYYIWADVSHDVIMNPELICDQYLKDKEISCFKHTARNCIYDEAKILLELGYDHKELIQKQIEFYSSKGYPKNNGLFELSAFARRNSYAINNACLKWWDNICRYSSRDQISFKYILWEAGIEPNIFPGFVNGFNERGTIGNNSIIPQTRQHVSSGP